MIVGESILAAEQSATQYCAGDENRPIAPKNPDYAPGR